MVSSPPLGDRLDWRQAKAPGRQPLRGSHVLIRPLDPAADAAPLYSVSHAPHGDPSIWRYLFDGPYESVEDMRRALEEAARIDDPLRFALVPLPDERAAGAASYLRITPEHGVIEIGNIWFGPPLRHTTAATETIFLLARNAFDDLGYRRLEWKCNALNAASRNAAERFGFIFEGVFRNHMVIKGRSRDTAWYAITADEWPSVRTGFERWLAPANFDAGGRQRQPLRELIARARS